MCDPVAVATDSDRMRLASMLRYSLCPSIFAVKNVLGSSAQVEPPDARGTGSNVLAVLEEREDDTRWTHPGTTTVHGCQCALRLATLA